MVACPKCLKIFKNPTGKPYKDHIQLKLCIQCKHCQSFFKRKAGLDNHINLLRCDHLRSKDVGSTRIIYLISKLQREVSTLQRDRKKDKQIIAFLRHTTTLQKKQIERLNGDVKHLGKSASHLGHRQNAIELHFDRSPLKFNTLDERIQQLELTLELRQEKTELEWHKYDPPDIEWIGVNGPDKKYKGKCLIEYERELDVAIESARAGNLNNEEAAAFRIRISTLAKLLQRQKYTWPSGPKTFPLLSRPKLTSNPNKKEPEPNKKEPEPKKEPDQPIPGKKYGANHIVHVLGTTKELGQLEKEVQPQLHEFMEYKHTPDERCLEKLSVLEKWGYGTAVARYNKLKRGETLDDDIVEVNGGVLYDGILYQPDSNQLPCGVQRPIPGKTYTSKHKVRLDRHTVLPLYAIRNIFYNIREDYNELHDDPSFDQEYFNRRYYSESRPHLLKWGFCDEEVRVFDKKIKTVI